MAVYSHSRLSTFENCSLQYKFKYIDKIKPDFEQSIEGFLGNQVHNILEWIYIQAKQGNSVELDSALQRYIQNWNKNYSPAIKIVKDLDAKHYFDLGVKFLIDYHPKYYPFKDNTIATEHKIFVDLDSEGKYKLIGFIDRLVYNQEKNIFEIHDYKTSGFLKSQAELDKDRQLALYSMAIRKNFPDAEEVHLIWHFLAHNKKIISKRTDEQLEKLRQEIIQLIQKIELTTEFKPNPSILCKWCEFRSKCPLFKNGYVDLTNQT